MYNKKGVSAVVATVLIILITVAAVTIIWAAIIPMINDQLTRGTVCLDAMTALAIENRGYTCYDDVNDITRVQISHGSKDVGLEDIQILVSDIDGNTASFLANTTEVTGNLPSPNGMSVLLVAATGNAESVAIAPIVKVGGQKETCDASAPVQLSICD